MLRSYPGGNIEPYRVATFALWLRESYRMKFDQSLELAIDYYGISADEYRDKWEYNERISMNQTLATRELRDFGAIAEKELGSKIVAWRVMEKLIGRKANI